MENIRFKNAEYAIPILEKIMKCKDEFVFIEDNKIKYRKVIMHVGYGVNWNKIIYIQYGNLMLEVFSSALPVERYPILREFIDTYKSMKEKYENNNDIEVQKMFLKFIEDE